MALDYTFGSEISEAIRNLLLCRVKLQSAAAADDEYVTLSSAAAIPSNRFFLNYTTACQLVQPSAADTPAGITHQEAVTVDEAATYDEDADGTKIYFDDGISNAYDTDAYIRPVTIPDISSGLQFIDSDFITSLNFAPNYDWFPGAIVTRMKMEHEWHTAAGTVQFKYHFRVYYCDLLRDDRNNADTLWDAGENLMQLIMEDNYLGGTVNWSEVVDMFPWYSSELAKRGARFFGTSPAHSVEVGWVQFDISCIRYAVWPKHSTTE